MKSCSRCKESKPLTAFNKDCSKNDGLYPTCTPCINADRRAKYIASSAKILDRNEKWRQANPEKLRMSVRKSYIENRNDRLRRNADWRHRNPDAYKACAKEWAANNPDRTKAAQIRYRAKGLHNAANGTRRAAMRNAVPKWLTESQAENIDLYYSLAKSMAMFDGQKYDVDHIEPLTGKDSSGQHISCGLHVPWNLQIMEHRSNCAKGCRV